MKFKIKKSGDRPKHTELVSTVGWLNDNELYSIGDDNQICKWDINGEPVSYLSFMHLTDFVISSASSKISTPLCSAWTGFQMPRAPKRPWRSDALTEASDS
jgi:WD40 repeat protein